jgi:uncharacterized membrane protein YccF (DUF307 family)
LRVIGNILWLIFGGLEMAFGYVLAGLFSIILIVTIPLVVPAFRMAGFCLWPFGRAMVRQPGAGAGSAIGNVVWFILFGLLLALGHFIVGVLLCITIIGIPFGVAHFKLAGLAVRPYGKYVVDISQVPVSTEAMTVAPLG